jgi:hypothetical protein
MFDSGIEIRAAGRSAICLLIWLEDLVKAGGGPFTSKA